MPPDRRPGKHIRVLLAEDQGMMRGALALLLGMEPDIEVVAQVAAGDAIVDAAQTHRPDVALLDIELPGQSGLDAAAELREQVPDCRVLILTTFARPGYLRRAMPGRPAHGCWRSATPTGRRSRASPTPCSTRTPGRRSRS
ncbi:response regulator, partial [Streptomyces nigra]